MSKYASLAAPRQTHGSLLDLHAEIKSDSAFKELCLSYGLLWDEARIRQTQVNSFFARIRTKVTENKYGDAPMIFFGEPRGRDDELPVFTAPRKTNPPERVPNIYAPRPVEFSTASEER